MGKEHGNVSTKIRHTDESLLDAAHKGDTEYITSWLTDRKTKGNLRASLNFLKQVQGRTKATSYLAAIREPGSGHTALHLACLCGAVDVCNLLLSEDPGALLMVKDRRGCLSFHLAAWSGHFECVDALIKRDMELHGTDREMINAQNNAKETSLHLAAQNGHNSVVNLLLKVEADASLRNAKGETPLDAASRLGRVGVVRLLVRNRPQLVLQSIVDSFHGNTTDQQSLVGDGGGGAGSPKPMTHGGCCFPLHLAAKNGHTETVRALLEGGFDIDFLTESGSALHLAALFGRLDVVRLLLEYGISTLSRDWQGRTAVEALLEHNRQQATDLTQLMQHREEWRHAVQIITDYENKLTNQSLPSKDTHRYVNSVSPTVIQVGEEDEDTSSDQPSPASYQNTPVRWQSQPSGREESDVWQRLPASVALTASRGNGGCPVHERRHTADEDTTAVNDIYYRPLSIQADLLPPSSLDGDTTSTIALSSLPSPSEGRSSTLSPRPFPPQLRQTRTTSKSPSSGASTVVAAGCKYVAPVGYDAWEPKEQNYDNLMTDPHAAKGYDNVPKNLISYDNAPPPGRKRWEHECTCAAQQTGKRWDKGKLNGTRPEDNAQEEEEVVVSCMSVSQTTSPSVQSDSAAKSATMSDIASTAAVVAAASPRMAPLATAEELSSSLTATEEGVSIFSGSPERTEEAQASTPIEQSEGTKENSMVDESNCSDRQQRSADSTPDQSPPGIWASESKIFETIYPVVEELRRSSLCSASSPMALSLVTEERRDAMLLDAPSLGERAKSADAPQCQQQLPSTTMTDSRRSPTEPMSVVEVDAVHDMSLCDSQSTCSECVAGDDSMVETQQSSDVMQSDGEGVQLRMDGSKVDNQPATNRSKQSPFDEAEEWKKINDIMESFGGAICRESVFVERCEPKLAVYMKNRRSAALTLTLANRISVVSDNNNDGDHTAPSTNAAESATKKRSFSAGTETATEIGLWLRNSGFEDWKPLAKEMEVNGFDRFEFLPFTFTKYAIGRCGIAKNKPELQLSVWEACQRIPQDERLEIPDCSAFTYVSDWLLSLGLEDYLGCFMRNRFDNLSKICQRPWSHHSLRKLGISLIGHRLRLLISLGEALEDAPPPALSPAFSPPRRNRVLSEDTATISTVTDGEPLTQSVRSQSASGVRPYSRCSSSTMATLAADYGEPIADSCYHAAADDANTTTTGSDYSRNSDLLEPNNISTIDTLRHHTEEEEPVEADVRIRSAVGTNAASAEEPRTATSSSCETEGPNAWLHDPATLIHDHLTYSAHYLGSVELKSPTDTLQDDQTAGRESKNAMIKLKRTVREIAKIPQVVLEISYRGVRILDAQSNRLVSDHKINRIHRVCQDDRDLNVFAYISQDGSRHFCHVFCVLTADVSTEIILTLGQCFEVAYQLATKKVEVKNFD